MTLANAAKYIRSKNAGPFWMTIDIFFEDENNYRLACNSKNIDAATIAALYGAPKEHIKVFCVDLLRVVKISIPRPTVQGGTGERDMHAGQRYVSLLDIEL